MQTTHNRIIWADLLRIVSVFAVILLHYGSALWGSTVLGSWQWQASNFFDSITRWCVPVFIMLSGMQFLNPEKNLTYTSLYKKSISRILAALTFWGIVYGILNISFNLIFDGAVFRPAMIKTALLKIPFGPPHYHLWYLYAILGLYIITPMWRIFTAKASQRDMEYLLLLFFIFGTCIPIYNKYASYKLPLGVPEISYFSGYYLAGYYFTKYKIQQHARLVLYALGVLSIAFTFIATYLLSMHNQKPDDYFYDNLKPNTLFAAFAVFLLFQQCWQEKKFSLKTETFIITLSGCTFGIYLIHDIVMKVLTKMGFTPLVWNPWVMIPALTVPVFLISFFAIFFYKKIPWLGKMTV